MHQPLDSAVLDASQLLRSLPRLRTETARAHQCLDQFRREHPEIRADLVVDRQPGSMEVNYDLLLGDSDEETLALSWNQTGTDPWVVKYTEHWAANFVASVNGSDLTVQDVLMYLRMIGGPHPELLDLIVDIGLIRKTLRENPVEVSDEEVQRAADSFRIRNGLRTPEATQRWMKEMGISDQRFYELGADQVRLRKLKERIAGDAASYFNQHRNDFDQVQLIEVTCRNAAEAEGLVKLGQVHDLYKAAGEFLSTDSQLNVTTRSCSSYELAPDVRDLPAGGIIGPLPQLQQWRIIQVLRRTRAEFDDKTRKAIRDRLFEEWLKNQREQAAVQWHWM